MDIAIDVRSLMEGRRSGVEVYTIELIQALLRIAPQHTLHLFYNSYRPVTLPTFTGRYTVHAFHYPNKVFNVSQLAGWPRWDTLVPADCLLVPNMRLVPRQASTPLVVTAHDLSFERFPEFYSSRRRLWHKLMRPRSLMQQATHIIAVSAATARDITELYGIPADKISVIPSGVPTESTVPRPATSIQQRFNLPARFVLYLGTLEPRKNIPSLIRAFSAIAERIPHHLVIAGTPGWLMQEIIKATAASPVSKRIHLVGFVSEQEKAALYASADLFVYPSFYEGFGFPPLEALLHGTPVITSNNSSLPEVVGEWATLVDPYQPAELAAVMTEVLQRPERVPVVVQHDIRQRYSWDRTAAQTLTILEQL